MTFIVRKKIKGNDYYYLQESKRVDGKVKSICRGYLGKDLEEAKKKLKKMEKEKIEPKLIEKSVESGLTKVDVSIEELANFCKAKGFVFRSSEIYGGFAGFWDFGPLGVEMFNNIKTEWWNFFVRRENMIGIEASVISSPRTWKASGHLDSFNDVFVKCKKCGKTGKLDEGELGKINCASCGGEYESLGRFNLMFSTKVGAIDPEVAYLRGETAQAMFMDFKLIQQTSRMQLPFGIAQIGRCFRNEIAPRDFLFRSREFHIGEFEFFINPEATKCYLLEENHLNCKFRLLDEETQLAKSEVLKEVTIGDLLKKKKLEEWHAYWLAEQIFWFRDLGLEKIKIREHTKDELAFYSSATFDIDYEYSFGSQEVAGNANRGQYDLGQHEKESKSKMDIFDEKSGKKILPKVIEPTFGIERVFLALLSNAFYKNEKQETVLKLPVRIAPIKVAILPLMKKLELEEISKKIFEDLKKEFNCVYDKSGSVGRRYARNDEVGTPFCITIDYDSIKKKDVTIRDRDSTKQIRIKISEIKSVLRQLIVGEIDFSSL